MLPDDINERLQKDRNVFSTYQTGKKLIKRARELETVPPLLDHSIFLTKLILMKTCNLKIEEVDELLCPSEPSRIRITEDVNAAFIELRNEFESSKQMALSLGISEGVVSMYVNRKRKLTMDKMIEYLKRVKRKYIIEV